MKPDASFDPVSGQAGITSARELQRPAEIAVCGSVLVEIHPSLQRVEIALYGRLDCESALAVQDDLLAPADLAGRTTLLDLTHLDDVEPLAFRVLADRQQTAHAEGMQLFIRIVAEQACRVIDAHVDTRGPLS